jgi:RNA polymerase primary sigma factor
MSMLDIQPFMRQVAKNNQKLTNEEEVGYFKIVHSDNFSQDVKNLAINKIIKNHILFVVTCANKFANKTIEVQDLIQEGVIGMKTAILKYNENGDVKFLSYAVWYILQRIRRYVDSYSSVIYLPKRRKQEADKITHKLKTKNLDDLNLSKEELNEYQTIINAINVDSLNAVIPGFENEPKEMIDTIEDSTFVNDLANADLNKQINLLLNGLSEREIDSVKQKYGIDGYDPTKLCEIGEYYGLRHQRISQINKQILAKLRRKIKKEKINFNTFI